MPEPMIEDILDHTEADQTELLAVASYDTARTRIAAELPIFLEQPPPENLARDVLCLFRLGLDAAKSAAGRVRSPAGDGCAGNREVADSD